jgi:hypothetical protein
MLQPWFFVSIAFSLIAWGFRAMPIRVRPSAANG